MATKTIKFRQTSDGASSLADGANGVLLATGTDGGEYPTTVSGITLGWTPDNNSGMATTFLHGAAQPFQQASAFVASGGPARRIRIDRAAGTFALKMQVYMPDGAYASTALRVLDADGTTVLFAQPVVTRTTDGLGSARQINTDNSLVAVGAADSGTTITTTGAQFFVELTGAGGFFTRLTYLEFDDGIVGGGFSRGAFRRRIASLY